MTPLSFKKTLVCTLLSSLFYAFCIGQTHIDKQLNIKPNASLVFEQTMQLEALDLIDLDANVVLQSTLAACSGSTNNEVNGFSICASDESALANNQIGLDRNSYFGPGGGSPSGSLPSESYTIDFAPISSVYPCINNADIEDIILTITINNVTFDFPSGMTCCEAYFNGVFANLYQECPSGELCPVIGDGMTNDGSPANGDCNATGERLEFVAGNPDFPLPYTTITTCLDNELTINEVLNVDVIPSFVFENAASDGCNCSQSAITSGHVAIDFTINYEYIFCSGDLPIDCAPVTFDAIDPVCDTDGFVSLPTFSNEGITGTWDVGSFLDVSNEGGNTVTAVFTPDASSCTQATASIDIMVNKCCSAEAGALTPTASQSICSSGGNFLTLQLNGDLNNFTPNGLSFQNGFQWLLVDPNGVIIDNANDLNNIDFPANTSSDPIDYCVYGISYKLGPGLGTIINGTTTINIGDADVLEDDNGNPLEATPDAEGACMDLSNNCVTITVEAPATAPMIADITTCDAGATAIIPSGGGTDFNFYDDAALSNLLASGASYDPNPSTGMSVEVWVTAGTGTCESAATIVTVTLENGANAGTDNIISICTDATPIVDLLASLNGSPDPTGVWSDDDGSGADISLPTAVDFSAVATNTYNFTYTIAASGGCPEATAVLTIEVAQPSNAGTSNAMTACNDGSLIDLEAILGTPDAAGIWSDDDGTGVSLADASAVDFSGIAAATYNFTYSIAANGACAASTATATINLKAAPNAGQDGTQTFCIGASSSIDLEAALGSTADTGGTWTDTNASGADISTPSAVDFSSIAVGTYDFTYTVSIGSSCPDDMAVVRVNVIQQINFGNDVSITLCEGDATPLDFFSAISADMGGIWTDTDGSGLDISSPSIIDISTLNNGSYNFDYTVVGTTDCPGGTATLNITIEATPNAGLAEPNAQLCQDATTPVDLFSLLTGEDAGGTWTETSGTPSLGMAFDGATGTFDPTGQATGTYIFTYTLTGNPLCGNASNQVAISINANPIVDLGTDINQCVGDGSSTLDAGNAGATYLWTTTPADANNGLTSQTITIPDSPIQSMISVEVTQNNCSNTDVIAVTIADAPTFVEIIKDCSADLDSYSVTITTDGDMLVANEGTVVDNMDGTFTISDVTSGNELNITISNSATNCSANFMVDAPDCGCNPVNAPVGNDVAICMGEAIPNLMVTSDLGTTVNWYNDAAATNLVVADSDIFTPSQAGTFFAQAVEIATNCPSIITPIILTINTLPTFVENTKDCSADLATYSVTITTDGDMLVANEGTVVDNMDGTFTISDVTSGNELNITISNSATNCSANFMVDAPDCGCNPVNAPVGNDVAICMGEAIPNLMVTSDLGTTVNWYNDAAATNLVVADSDIFTPSQAGTFFAQAVEIATNCPSIITPIILTINTLPTFVENTKDCSADLATYSVTITTDGDMLVANEGTVVDNMDGTFTISDVTSGNELNITISNSTTNCSAEFIVTAPDCGCNPVNPPVGNDVAICMGEAIPNLVVTSDLGTTVNWYNDAAATNLVVADSDTFTPTQAGTFFAQAVETATNCPSIITPITLTINTLPTFVENTKDCSADLATYSINLTSDGDMLVANEGTVVDNMDGTFTISDVTSGNELNITISNSTTNCSAEFIVTAPDCGCNPVNPPVGNDVAICMGEAIPNLVVTSDLGTTVNWYNDAAATNLVVADSDTFTPTQAGTFFAQAVETATNCPSIITPITLTINTLPTFAENIKDCSADLATYSVTITTDGDMLVANEGTVVDNMDGTFTISDVTSGNELNITISNSTTNCSAEFIVTAPDCGCPMYGQADIQTTCNDNNTPNDDSDDTFSYTIELASIGLGATYAISGDDTQTNVAYDAIAGPLGDFLISAGNLSIDISDEMSAICGTTFEVEAPESCSTCVETVEAGMSVELNCANPMQTLQGTASSAGTFNWTGPNTFSANATEMPQVSEAGMYYLTVNFDNGCVAIDSVLVTLDPSTPIADAGIEQTITCTDLMVQLGGANTSTGSDYSYAWTSDNGFISTDINPTTNMAGTYTLVVTDNINNCTSESSVVTILENNTTPIAIITADPMTMIDCIISEIELSADPNNSVSTTYTWTFDDVVTESQSLTATASGIYNLLVLDTLNGCSELAQIEVENNVDYPIIDFAAFGNLDCINTSVTLDASASQVGADISYEWQDITGAALANGTLINVENPGQFIFEAMDASNGCLNADTVTVTQNIVLPNVEAGTEQALDCNTMTTVLQGSSNTTNSTIDWMGQNNTVQENTILTPTVTATDWYYLTVTDMDNGCANIDSVLVTQPDLPASANLQIQQPDCGSSDFGNILISNVDGGTAPFLYNIDGNMLSSDPIFSNLSPAAYTIGIEDANGCLWDSTVVIQPSMDIVVDLGPDQELTLGDSVLMNPILNILDSSIDTILWTATQAISCSDCLSPWLMPAVTTTYTIFVEDINGCTATDQITITVRPDKNIFIPTAFSPNDDGINDLFSIYAADNVANIKHFLVLDRWGNAVFEARDFRPQDGIAWDGRWKTKSLDAAVFVYFAEIEFLSGEVQVFKGDVTLVK